MNLVFRLDLVTGLKSFRETYSFSCSGRVTGWAAYSERAGTYATITFQVWRPLANATSDSCNSYQLVDSHTFTNIATDSTKLLNISSVVDFELSPIPFLAGDVVGFHADFSGGRRVSVQSNRTGGSISYYTGGVDSASSGVVSTCQDLGSTEIGAPVITAYVTMQGRKKDKGDMVTLHLNVTLKLTVIKIKSKDSLDSYRYRTLWHYTNS